MGETRMSGPTARARLNRLLLVLAALLCLGAAPVLALDSQPDQFEQKLRTYDPAAVTAAQNYARTFNMRGMLEKSIPALTQAVTQQIKGKNPNINEAQAKEFVDTFLRSAFVDQAPVLEQATILLMLDIFSKDELTALNQFYSSPVGAGILQKMPAMMGRMPEVMQLVQTYVLPRALETARAHMQKNGVDVKI